MITDRGEVAQRMNGVVFITGTGERRELIATGERSESKVLATPGLWEIPDIISYAFEGMKYDFSTTYTGKCGHIDSHWHGNYVKIVYIPDLNDDYHRGKTPWADAKDFMNTYMNVYYPNTGRFTVGLHFEGNTCRAIRAFTLLTVCEAEDYTYYNDGTIFFKLRDVPQFFAMLEIYNWRGGKFLSVDLDYLDVLKITEHIIKYSRNDLNLIRFLKNYFFLPRTERELMRYSMKSFAFSHIVWRRDEP